MTILADFQEQFSKSRRLYYIGKYEPDRINRTVKLTVGIFSDTATRDTMKAKTKEAKSQQDSLNAKRQELNTKAFAFSQLSTAEQIKGRKDFEVLAKAVAAEIRDAEQALNEVSSAANDSGPKTSVEFTLQDFDTDNITLEGLYKALADQLENPETV